MKTLFLIFSALALGQVPAPQPAPALPSDIALLSASYADHPGEKWAGTLSVALKLPTTVPSYSYNSWDLGLTKVNGKVTFSNSMRTGGALLVPQLSHGNFYTFFLGTAGVTTVNAAALASGSFGALAAYRIKGGPWGLWGDFQSSNTTGKTARVGALYSWGTK